jgi:hypothetical protein
MTVCLQSPQLLDRLSGGWGGLAYLKAWLKGKL